MSRIMSSIIKLKKIEMLSEYIFDLHVQHNISETLQSYTQLKLLNRKYTQNLDVSVKLNIYNL